MIKRKLHIILLLSLAIVLLSVTLLEKKITSSSIYSCLTTQKSFVAGKRISIQFEGDLTNKPQLFIIHSFGKTILDCTIENRNLQFNLPMHYCNKSGLVSWYLIENSTEKAKGTFEILPNDTTKTNLESYLGPPSTLVGDNHFVMFVSIPTDSYDNPKSPNTLVTIKNQFLNTINSETKKTKDFISWQNIYAPNKSGIVSISANCNATSTKEYDAVIYPSIPTNFTISYKLNHEFADGNQITQLTTSTIKDRFGNTISDGTLVSFLITNKQNSVLTTFGTTIEGIATGKILHPEMENEYKITAYVNGICHSNLIQINYKSINPTINYYFSKNNREIIIGPIKSFMNQLIPDGIKVNLNIYHNNNFIETLVENSYKGKATFYLSPESYKEEKYSFEIETLGKIIKIPEKNVSNK